MTPRTDQVDHKIRMRVVFHTFHVNATLGASTRLVGNQKIRNSVSPVKLRIDDLPEDERFAKEILENTGDSTNQRLNLSPIRTLIFASYAKFEMDWQEWSRRTSITSRLSILELHMSAELYF